MTCPKRLLCLLTLFAMLVALPISRAHAGDDDPVAPEAEPRTLTPDEAASLALVDEIALEVEEIRGLRFREKFKRKIISPDEIRELVIQMAKEEMPAELLENTSRLWSRLGFFAPGLDIMECMMQFLEAGALGLYDDQTKTLYLLEGFSPDGARPVIFHELIHALEDQHIGLGIMRERALEDSDRGSAAQAVVEGTASYFTEIYLKRHPQFKAAMEADAMKKMAEQVRMIMEVPSVLILSSALFPYGNAPRWVRVVTGGDLDKITALYDDIPVSTEQVLHPKKYGVDFPYRIVPGEVGDQLPAGWSRAHQDSLGELHVGLLMNEFEGGPAPMKIMRAADMLGTSIFFRGRTRQVSKGWDGDQVVSYHGPNQETALLWASRWDTPEDAREFEIAYLKACREVKIKNLPEDQQAFYSVRRGDRVVIAEGFPRDLNARMAMLGMDRTTFTPDERDRADVEAAAGK